MTNKIKEEVNIMLAGHIGKKTRPLAVSQIMQILEKAINNSRNELIEKVEGMQDRSQSSASLVWNDTLDQVIKVLKSPTADKKKDENTF